MGQMSQAMQSVRGQSWPHGSGDSLLYLASGIFPDWSYGDRGLLAYTIELTGSGDKLDAFIQALSEAEILEVVRSGATGIARGEKGLHL